MTGAHPLINEFGRAADFEGQLAGVLARIEAAGDGRVLDGLFATNDIETGELAQLHPTITALASRVAETD